ncbi:MAG: hypothetical protein P1U63_00025 [Coxiellaceae bacterium]|nr:hypothetical protein [Coxiellaceae bacterium]
MSLKESGDYEREIRHGEELNRYHQLSAAVRKNDTSEFINLDPTAREIYYSSDFIMSFVVQDRIIEESSESPLDLMAAIVDQEFLDAVFAKLIAPYFQIVDKPPGTFDTSRRIPATSS